MENELIEFLVAHKDLGHKYMSAPETWIFQTADLPEKFKPLFEHNHTVHVVLKDDITHPHQAHERSWLVYL